MAPPALEDRQRLGSFSCGGAKVGQPPSVLQSRAPRRITPLTSLEVRQRNFDGIYYPSRYGHDLENWALFEPFRIRRATSQALASDDPTFVEALRILGLNLVD